MNEETESTDRTLLNGSDSTRARLVRGKLVKSVFVPICAAQMVHGPRGSTIQTLESVTGYADVIMELKSGTKMQNMTIHTK